ncbi:hypothetical protein [Pseudomonas fragariae (ex Marin et al. 2024)]|uniref:hypothetical protein n=1 Tax=Pseudomonas fragariae (ex Marin et al. 2024) TaxID=3080056 RepID=UPI003F7A1B46
MALSLAPGGMMEISNSKPAKTSNAYVGFERYAKLTELAIALSYKVGKQISPSQLCQYLIDNYAGDAATKYSEELEKTST